ncbi:hypothetical protein AAG906_029696 [Vitis piasezkii]
MPKYGPAFGMATNSSSSTSDIIISSSSSSHQMETSHLPITAHKLNGQNYLQWSQSILMFIRGKEKDDYITEKPYGIEYFNTLTRLWRQLDTFEVIGSGTLAHKGNFLSAFIAGKKRKKPWIVDSGASDHMTEIDNFDTYSSCPNNLTIRIADGSLSKVAEQFIVLSRDLTLNSILLTIGNLEECSGLYILKGATIHKNNLKWRLVVILFGFMSK